MINLTPKAEKKKIKADFYMRLLIVFCFSLSISIAISVIAMVPSYFALKVSEKNVLNNLEVQKNTPVPVLDQETVDLIKDTNGKISLIEDAEKNNFVISEKVINQIIFSKMPDIKVGHITYTKTESGERSINIYGVAPSRERLLLFRRALEENPNFKDVNLPISNFIKGSNISFFLSMRPS